MLAEPKPDTSRQTTSLAPNASIPAVWKFDKAREAVEGWLELGWFISRNMKEIYKKLEECDKHVADAGIKDCQDFFDKSLPLISSLIQVGSSRMSIIRAVEQVKQNWPDADPAYLLSELMFIYIVSKREDFLGAALRNKKKKMIWNRISRRMENLIN